MAAANLDGLNNYNQVNVLYPPESLNPLLRIDLGIKYIEKFGETLFTHFQKVYRLTKDEYNSICNQAKNYKKDIIQWKSIGDGYAEDVETIKEAFPQATFKLLRVNYEDKPCFFPIAEINGQVYDFYSEAAKVPTIDDSYISEYRVYQEAESRPNFRTIKGDGRMIFLREFKGDQTLDFRNTTHLALLIDLIFRFSQMRKGLDMLPSRLALQEGRLYCVDKKLCDGSFSTSSEAFEHNIKMLKNKITSRGFAETEESSLLAYVDESSKQCTIDLTNNEIAPFEEKIKNIEYSYKLRNHIIPNSLNSQEKVHLAAAALKKFGTKDLFYVARDYQLSVADQQQAKKLVGKGLLENIIEWSSKLPQYFLKRQERAAQVLKKAGLEGQFASYLNQVGNYKDVLTAKIKGQIYVVSEVDQEYITKFEQQKKREHRPDYKCFPLEDNKFLFLTEFMGSQTIDYSNIQHLDLLIDLIFSFSFEGKGNTIDFNLGNLLIQNDCVYFIDKDLDYAESTNPLLDNFKNMLFAIRHNLHTEQEQKVAEQYVIGKFKERLNPNQPMDQEVLSYYIMKKNS